MTWNEKNVVAIMLRAGEMALGYLGNASIDVKDDQSLVTQADLAIEAMFEEIFDRPEEGMYLIGEESIAKHDEDYIAAALSGEAMVVDPIDGTANFANGLEMWGVSLGYMSAGKLMDGAIYLPCFGELWLTRGDDIVLYRVDAQGHADGGKIIKAQPSLSGIRSMTAVTQNIVRRGRIDVAGPLHAIASAVYPMVRMIEGKYGAYLGSLKLWDLAGGVPLLQRAGVAMEMLGGKGFDGLVNEQTFYLDAKDNNRWKLRDLIVFRSPASELSFSNNSVDVGI